jgi:tetratricopeptide (TPR) repeat protein
MSQQPQRAGATPQSGPVPAGKIALEPAKAIEAAGQLYARGMYPQAERVCRQIIKSRPKMTDAYNILAVTMNALGDPKEAVNLLRKATQMAPNNSSYFANMGEIERQRGNSLEASVALRKALSLDPKSPQALNNLGIVHFDEKEYDEAVECYEKAIAIQPHFAEVHNNLGNAYRLLDRGEDAIACYQRAVTQRPVYAEAYNNMATALRDKDDIDAAEHAYRKAIAQKPTYMEAYNNLANLLTQKNRTEDALRLLGDALKIDDKNVIILITVARVQLKRGNLPLAEQAALIALKNDPKNAEARFVLGQVYHDQDRHPEALAKLEEAIGLEPKSAEFQNFYGVVLKSVGRIEDAHKAVLKAVELNPKFLSAYATLNDLHTFTEGDPLLVQMQEMIAEAELPDTERYLPLHFALGKALEDVKQYEQALSHYLIGTKLKRGTLDYNETDSEAFFNGIKAAFPKEIFENRPFEGNPSDRPVFIVGMPRSGSTLVEQILQSHSKTFGAGEIKVLSRQLGVLRDRFPSIPKFPAMVGKLDPETYASIAEGYLNEVAGTAGNADRVTDKLLTNYFFVGLIHLLFPNAKIINTRRNPVDTCLSAYTKLFKDDMPHSYDFGELGRYYRRYDDLMQHWEKVLPPGVLTTVQYEEVTEDLEGNARRLLDHIGLEWEEACLSFHKSERAVKTASVVQVRKPVYKSSVERWRRYGSQLQPLLDSLGYVDPNPSANAKPAAKAAGKKAKA